MSTPQWNADIITPSISVDADVDIQTNGGLDKDASGALGVKVDNSTITINSAGALQANGGGSSYEFTDGLVESSGVVGIDMSTITSSTAGTYVTDDGQVGVAIDERTIVLDQDTEKLKVANPLPEFTDYDDGKVLTVVAGSDEYAATWSPIPAELPAKSASDAGKALVVNSAGTGVEWASVGGGSSYTFTDGLVESSGVVSVDIGTAGLDMIYDEDLGKYVLGVKADDSTITVEDAVVKVLNPLPISSASDAGKVLSVDSSGSAGWEASKSLAAGSGISITESSGVVTIAASGGGSSYTFTDGVSESSGVVSVDHPVPAPAASDSGKMLSCVDTSGTLGWVAPAAGLTMGHNNMTLSGGGMLEARYGFPGKGWYIGNLVVGSDANTPVTGPVTGTTLMLTGCTNSSYAHFAGTGSVVNLNYSPIAVIQFLFCLNSADNGISLSILDSTGADVTSTLATGVTNRLEWFKMTSTL